MLVCASLWRLVRYVNRHINLLDLWPATRDTKWLLLAVFTLPVRMTCVLPGLVPGCLIGDSATRGCDRVQRPSAQHASSHGTRFIKCSLIQEQNSIYFVSR